MEMKSTYDSLAEVYCPLLTVRDCAKITGLSEKTWRTWVGDMRRCPVPVVRLGRTIRVRLVDLASWIDGEVVMPRPKLGASTKAERVRRKQREQ